MNCMRCFSIGLIGLAVAGCGRSDRVPVAGRVTIDGMPVDLGLIIFEPTEATNAAAGASINDGKFTTEVGHGLRPGTYQVNVRALRRTGRKIHDRQAAKEIDEIVAIKVKKESVPATITAQNAQSLELRFTAAR